MADLITRTSAHTATWTTETTETFSFSPLTGVKVVPVVTARGDGMGADPDDMSIDVSVNTGTQEVTVTRGSADGNVTIEILMTEIDTAQVNIQTGTFAMTSAETTDSVTITSLTLTKSWCLRYYECTGGDDDWDHYAVEAFFGAATTIDFTRDQATGAIDGHWWSLECIGTEWDVQHLTDTHAPADNATVKDKTMTAVTLARTFLVMTWFNDLPSQQAHGAVWIGQFLNSTTIRATRHQEDSSFQHDFRYMVVQLASGKGTVQALDSTSAGSTINFTGLTAVDTGASFAMPSNYKHGGNSDNNVAIDWESTHMTVDVVSTTAVDVLRGNDMGVQVCAFHGFLIEMADAGPSTFPVACVDGVAFADVVAEIGTFPESATDAANFADVVAEVGTFPETVVDVVNLADLVTEFATFPAAVVDAVSFADVVAGNIVGAGIAVFCVDTVSFADETEPTPRILSKSELTKRILELDDLFLLHILRVLP